MSIRSNSLPVGNDISLQLQDILRKNGIQAQLAMNGDKYMLYVQGHDSPLIPYTITRNQYLALVDGGTNGSNKQAYKTFVNIVHNDFDCPKDYVHARNANGKVTMGLHGYRVQDMGRAPHPFLPPHHPTGHHFPHHHMAFPHVMMPHSYLGWTARQQDGFHMRRVNGSLVMQHGMMIPEREGGRLKPGELQSGAYGFYYKGGQQQVQQRQSDPLQDLQTVIKPADYAPEPAKKYRDLIPSAVYFTNDKWQECLESHGIQVDADNKRLIVQNAGTPYATSYDLTDNQVKKLTSNNLKDCTVPQRIDIINGLISKDFNNKLTFDMLNSTEQPKLDMKAETIQSIDAETRQHLREAKQQQQTEEYTRGNPVQEMNTPNGVNGHSLDETNKGWYRQINNGREVEVGDIWVEKDFQSEGKLKMSAVINGEVVSHEISQKQYDKFLALDDYHRMKMFDKVFDEVKMKNIPGQGMNFGQALLSSLALVGETTRMTAGIAHDIEHIKHPHSGPDVYVEGHQHHGRVFIKAGLDTPESIAGRIFDAGMNQGFRDAMLHR